MSRLVLVGLPGVGKTSVVRRLGSELACPAVDTDDVLSRAVGCPASEYLRREGEEAFRIAEVAALVEALDDDNVVATGGGVVTTITARELLAKQITFWLDCDDDVIVTRLGRVDRPLIDGDVEASLAALRRDRAAWYEEVSRARIDATGAVRDVAQRVREALLEVNS
jgi:shikimate kinase